MDQGCPRCGGVLAEKEFGGTRVDGCDTCGGVWFDFQELNAVTRNPRTGLVELERAYQRAMFAETSGGDMKCPRCQVSLYAFRFPHTPEVELDACPQCKGIWVDDGEMVQIAERVEAARQGKAATSRPTPAEDARRYQNRTVTAFLLSAPCPHCDTANPASSLVCWACGAALKTRPAYSPCPRCDQPLEERSCGAVSSARVDVCLSCTGVWMEQGEISAFYQLGVEVVNEIQSGVLLRRTATAASERPARCPNCHYEMQRRSYGGRRTVDLDVCPYCRSLWLDAGELLAVYDLMRTGEFTLSAESAADPWANAD